MLYVVVVVTVIVVVVVVVVVDVVVVTVVVVVVVTVVVDVVTVVMVTVLVVVAVLVVVVEDVVDVVVDVPAFAFADCLLFRNFDISQSYFVSFLVVDNRSRLDLPSILKIGFRRVFPFVDLFFLFRGQIPFDL